jgi:hypothetical protein
MTRKNEVVKKDTNTAEWRKEQVRKFRKVIESSSMPYYYGITCYGGDGLGQGTLEYRVDHDADPFWEWNSAKDSFEPTDEYVNEQLNIKLKPYGYDLKKYLEENR